MKYIDEFRNPDAAQRLLALIGSRSTRPVRLMEFCGGHTHAIFKFGLRQLLPPTVRLLSGPGCPVCVTASSDVDRAIAMAHLPGVIMTTFGDMMRVPGSPANKMRSPDIPQARAGRSPAERTAGHSPAERIQSLAIPEARAGRSPAKRMAGRSLQDAKARGADVRMVYSTLDALSIARSNPDRQVIFLGIGFETTAPTVAAAILQAQVEGLGNFCVLSLHKLTPPATKAILDAGEVQLSGIIGPGHVTTVIGSDAWEFLPLDYGISCAIAGFEPLDILQAVYFLVDAIERDTPTASNAYTRSVSPEGNRVAQRMMHQVFQVVAAEWRGLGTVPASGLTLRDEYAAFDATRRFPVEVGPSEEPKGCRCGEVLRGVTEPSQCPLFARVCTPEHPIGPCMVSSEGACAAHMQYGEM
jgi:hydrogenase expression/formation protein HypD